MISRYGDATDDAAANFTAAMTAAMAAKYPGLTLEQAIAAEQALQASRVNNASYALPSTLTKPWWAENLTLLVGAGVVALGLLFWKVHKR